ncbi:MFS transporter [Salinifilum aidingensis]
MATTAHPPLPESPEHRPDASESQPERLIRLTGQPVGIGFVALYILAMFGLWVALMTPASVTLSLRVAALDPEGKTTSLALVTGIGAIFAMVTNPVFGHLSDRSTSRWGQRRPFMLGGTLFGTVALFVIGVAPNILVVTIGWCLTQICLNAALAAMIALLPERVPDERRGKVSGLMGMTSQVAQVVGTFLVQFTGTSGIGMFLVPAAIGLVSMLAFTFYLKEMPKSREELPRKSWMDIPRSLWINPVKHPDFAWAFLSRFLVWIAVALLTTYKTYFLMDRLGHTSAEAAEILVWTMLTLAITVVLASSVSGWWSDRAQRRKAFVAVASALFGVGMIVIAFSHSVAGFILGVAIAGIGQGVYVGVDYALVASVLPNSDTEAAKGMGVFNIANALPQTIGPMIAPIFLAIGGGENYTALYLGAATFAAVGATVLRFIKIAR